MENMEIKNDPNHQPVLFAMDSYMIHIIHIHDGMDMMYINRCFGFIHDLYQSMTQMLHVWNI